MSTTIPDTRQSHTPRERLIERATHRALEQAGAGNTPVLLRHANHGAETIQTWSIGSRTTGGAVYVIEATASAAGIQTCCTCAAADADRLCWHRAAVRLALFGDIAYTDGRRPVEHLARLGNDDLYGPAA